ncbi:MAG: PIN domain-containing protein [Myxococcales bacterium]|nr:PIN domain-containing protein [Myxococcales bacterium]
MSADPQFVDTNVLVYLFDNDAPEKQSRSQALLASEGENLILSTQVLGEFYVTVTRKLATPLTPELARGAVSDLCALRVRPIRAELVQAAVRRSEASKLSYWDSLIIETAIDAGASVLWTEDLQDGQILDGLRIANPFHATG